jgi:hypothetical protein
MIENLKDVRVLIVEDEALVTMLIEDIWTNWAAKSPHLLRTLKRR